MKNTIKELIKEEYKGFKTALEVEDNQLWYDSTNGIKRHFKTQNLEELSEKDLKELLDYAQEERNNALLRIKGIETFQEKEQVIEQTLAQGYYFYGLKDIITSMQKEPPVQVISTGYENIDENLNGGFRPGLYTLNGVTGIGKTSFVLNLAKNILKQNKKVLFISLEMPKQTITGMLLSMCSLAEDEPYTVIEILENKELAEELYNKYEETYNLDKITVVSVGNQSIDNVTKAVRQFVSEDPLNKPVVIIDYLQKMNVPGKYDSERLKVDKSLQDIVELKNNYDLTILLISSISRSAYTENSSIGSGKETGNIEYQSDIVMGLDYGIDPNAKDKNTVQGQKASEDKPTVHLRISKNRTGKPVQNMRFEFDGAYRHFKELPNTPQQTPGTKRK